MTKQEQSRPTLYVVIKWHGYVIAGIFLLYGGVKIVLSMLERTYSDVSQSLVFLIVGVALLSVVKAYRDARPWGWYGLILTNSAVALLSLFGLAHAESVVLLIVSLLALTALLSPTIKNCVFAPH